MISFIIPAHNEEALLDKVLETLKASADAVCEPYEIIVSNDASTDATGEIGRQHGAKVVDVAHRQIAATRNSGAREASGGIFIFVDADTYLPPETIKAALSALEDPKVSGGGSSPSFEGTIPLFPRIILFFFVPLLRLMKYAPGCFIFCRREAFEAVGGFNEKLYASEELDMSIGLKRQGKFVILREPVITSGRKLRTFSTGEILRLMVNLLWRGPKMVQDRDQLEIWYGERRPDPGQTG